MKITTNGQDTIRVRMNEDINFAIQDDLIKTREKFLEYMGQLFDKAIYNSITEEKNDYLEKEVSDWREKVKAIKSNKIDT